MHTAPSCGRDAAAPLPPPPGLTGYVLCSHGRPQLLTWVRLEALGWAHAVANVPGASVVVIRPVAQIDLQTGREVPHV